MWDQLTELEPKNTKVKPKQLTNRLIEFVLSVKKIKMWFSKSMKLLNNYENDQKDFRRTLRNSNVGPIRKGY